MSCSYIGAGLSFSVFNPIAERENERRGGTGIQREMWPLAAACLS